MSTEMRKKAAELNKGRSLPVIWSYHIHCLFVNGDEKRVNLAKQLREDFISHFNLTNVKPCQSTFNDVRLCMFDFELIPELDSPFVSGNWAVMVPINWFDLTVRWIMQNRGEMDILVHPNSGAEVSDHLIWSLKAGREWPLNTAAFSNQTWIE